MDKRRYALVTVALSLLVGLIADLLFYQKYIGLSFPLFILTALAVLFGLSRLAQSASNRRNVWVVAPLVFFAVMVAVRADLTISLLNVAAVLWLFALLLHYRAADQALDQQPQLVQLDMVALTASHVLSEPPEQISGALAWMREYQPLGAGPWKSIGRGLLITLPILLVFGVLLGSADEIFGRYLGQIFNILSLDSLQSAIAQLFLVIVFGWLACGALAYSVLRHFPRAEPEAAAPVVEPAPVPDSAAADEFSVFKNEASVTPVTPPRKAEPFRLGMVETGIVLGAVNLMFAAFVVIQFAYFFGGQNNITFESGWTYAQYARRGFFELVAVSVMTLGLILWLDGTTVRATSLQHGIFRALSVGIVALTGVMLVSASGRMSIYEEAYGFTQLRLYVHVFIFWLAALFAVFLVALFRPRHKIFSFGVTLCIIGYLVTLNLVNVDYTIARENIDRFRSGHDLDVSYIGALSEDAVPAVLPLYATLAELTEKTVIGDWLSRQYFWLEAYHAEATLFSAHSARGTAWSLLQDALKNGDFVPSPDFRTLY